MADQNMKKDDVRKAPESGEPDVAGRSKGRILDEKGGPAVPGADKGKPEGSPSEHWESGRQHAE